MPTPPRPGTARVRVVDRRQRRCNDPRGKIRQELLRYILRAHRRRATQRARGLGPT